MRKFNWPSDEKLRDMLNTNKTQKQVARELGCCLPTLNKKLRQLGIGKRTLSKFVWPTDRELEEMSRTMLFKDIAKAIGCDQSMVSLRAKRLGIKSLQYREVRKAPTLWLDLPSYSELLGLLSNKPKKAVAEHLGVDYALFLKETERMGL